MTDSRAAPSGSESRSATSLIDCARACISRERAIVCAIAKKKPIGARKVTTSASSTGAKYCDSSDRNGVISTSANATHTADAMAAPI